MLVGGGMLATARALSVAGGRPALSRCSVYAPCRRRAGDMMIDGVFFPPTRMRPLVLLRLSNSRRLFLGGSRGLPGAGRSQLVSLAHRTFWAPPSNATNLSSKTY